jgi:hypothetical protein
MRCGHCKEENTTIEHVKACSQSTTLTKAVQVDSIVTAYVTAPDYRPMAVAPVIPNSYYALASEDGTVFYEVHSGKVGTKWDGFTFVDRLVGHPGSWAKYPVKGSARTKVLALIGENPLDAAARYGHEFTVCGVCHSPLSDPQSIARGIGPVCEAKF